MGRITLRVGNVDLGGRRLENSIQIGLLQDGQDQLVGRKAANPMPEITYRKEAARRE